MVSRSLEKLGAGRSILIDRDNEIIAGNLTTEQAAAMGLEEVIIVETDGNQLVAVKRTDMDLDDPATGAREMAYADNRAAVVSIDFDPEQVKLDYEAGLELGDWWQDFELEELGVIEPEPVEDVPPQIDRAEELREKWGVESGQLWQLGEHRVICGDCTDGGVVERVMDGELADLVLSDPPYGVGYDGGFTKEQDRLTGDRNADLYLPFMSALPCVDDAPIYIWFMLGKRSESVFAATRQAELVIRSVIIWAKNHAQFGAIGAQYKPMFEPLLYLFRKGHKPRWYGPTNETTLWQHARATSNKLHPTEKPIEIAERVMNNSSQRGDVVYDGFLGSGTTLIACERLGRKCYGVEIEPKYVAVTLQRWSDVTGREPVLVH
jgi:DNA modification methylase